MIHGHIQAAMVGAAASHEVWAYAVIFAALFLEGDALLFGVAFLAHQGVLDLMILIPLVLVGAVASDLVWYAIGMNLERLWPWLHRWVQHLAQPLDRHLLAQPERTILLAKFTYGGICRALMIRAGALKMPLDRFAAASVQGVLIWMPVVGGLGYAASAGLSWAGHAKYIQLSLALGVVLFVILEHLLGRRIRERL